MATNAEFAEGAHEGSKLTRSFPCRFCPREFRTAQALGGHMNVHRRERKLAKDLIQLQFDSDQHAKGCKLRGCEGSHHHHHHRHHHHKVTDVIIHGNIQNHSMLYPGSSSSASSSPPDESTDLFATSSLACNTCREKLLSLRDSKGDCPVTGHPAHVDLELRLGHRTPGLK